MSLDTSTFPKLQVSRERNLSYSSVLSEANLPIPHLVLSFNDNSNTNTCIPSSQVNVDNLILEYTEDGKKNFSADKFLTTKFLYVKDSLTLIDCYFATTAFKADKLGADFVFRDIKTLNFSITEVPDKVAFEEFLKMTPSLKTIVFDKLRADIDLLKIASKYKNIETVNFKGVDIPLQGLSTSNNTLHIDIDVFKAMPQLKSILDNKTQIALKATKKLTLDNNTPENIVSLELDNMEMSDDNLNMLIKAYPTINSLTLNNCKANDANMLSYPNLQKITVDGKKIKEHITVKVPTSTNTILNDIADYNEIKTLELLISKNVTPSSISNKANLNIENLILNFNGGGLPEFSTRVVGLNSTFNLQDTLTLINCMVDKDIYTNNKFKKLVMIIDNPNINSYNDNLLKYFNNVLKATKSLEEIEFAGYNIDFNILKTISDYKNIKKITLDGRELNLQELSFKNDFIRIDLDNSNNMELINEILLTNKKISLSVTASDYKTLQTIKDSSTHVRYLKINNMDISDNELHEILNTLPNLGSLKINNCNGITNPQSLSAYENLKALMLDDNSLFDIPGVIPDRNLLTIDLSLYDGSPILFNRYGKISALTILLDHKKKLDDINIIGTNSVTDLRIENTNQDYIIELNNGAEKFLNNFHNMNTLGITGCTPNLELFNKVKNLERLFLNKTNLYNSDLNCIPKQFNNLSVLKIRNSKNITDVSALSQLAHLISLDVSDNRIVKGIDLLLNYSPRLQGLNACNNLITNSQIEHLPTSILSDVDLSGNPITFLNFSGHVSHLDLKIERCLLSSIGFDKMYTTSQDYSKVNFRIGDSTRFEVACCNNPFLDPSKYLLGKALSFHTKKDSVHKEIMMLIDNVPEDEKRLAYITACKKYYNSPKPDVSNHTNTFNAYIGTLALMGIVNIDDDFYYCDIDNNIVPIIETDPTILLQDDTKSVSIVDSYLENPDANVHKRVHVYRMDTDEPKTLDLKNNNMLSMFIDGLKHRLPESLFFEFASKRGADVYVFELPKQLDLLDKMPSREFDKNTFANLLGNIKIKFVKEDGSSTFINIPNSRENQLGVNVEHKNKNLSTLKKLIGEEFFYLEDATDSDIVISNSNNKIDSFITFLTSHLPHEGMETGLEKAGSMQAISNSFNLNSYTSILRYGYPLQQEITEKLETLKSAMGNGQAERISNTLKRLDSAVNPAPRTNTLEIAPVNNKRGFFSSLFRRAEAPLQYNNSNTETQVDTIETIKEDLKSSAEIIMNGISTSKLTQDILNDYANKLRTYIDVAKHKLESCINNGNADKEQIRMLEDKIQSLEISELLSKGTSGQFEILVKNNARLFERVCQATQLIPVLTSQSILRSTIDSQNQILASNKDMYSYAQDTLISNANALKDTTEATESQENPTKMLKAVIESVDEIAKSTKEILNKTPKPQLTGSTPMLFDTNKQEELEEKDKEDIII